MANENAAWMVLVYMAGDNNLTEEMVWGLQELKKKSAELDKEDPGRIKVVAHFDPRGSRSRRYDFVPSVKKIAAEKAKEALQPESAQADDDAVKLTTAATKAADAAAKEAAEADADGNLASYEAVIYTRKPIQSSESSHRESKALGVTPEAALSSPLTAFVADQVSRLPDAQHHFLILSGHGSGAVGDFLIDSNPTTSLSIPTLALILKTGREKYQERFDKKGDTSEHGKTARRSEVDGKREKRIDILGMDSCLMSNAEVCCEVCEEADYLVASEGWVANAGWPYHRVLEACHKGGRNPESVARRVAQSYSDFYRDYEISEISTDIAVCQLEHFRNDNGFVGKVRALSEAFVKAFDTVYVDDALAMAGMRAKDTESLALAQAARQKLSEDISTRLRDPQLKDELVTGSAQAIQELVRVLAAKELVGSRRRALRELLHSWNETLGLDDAKLDEELRENWKPGLAEPGAAISASMALAIVRVRREFDPAIDKALKLIEDPERRELPETKEVRVALQKLHQLQSVLDLRELAEKPLVNVGDARRFLSAMVASRWQAQSFKGGVYVDLIDFCNSLEARPPDGSTKSLCEAVRVAAQECTLEKLQTGPASQHANGLAVYFPYQTTDYSTEYDNLAFARRTGWGRLVRSYLRATRRGRLDEGLHWPRAHDRIQRFGHSEVDPLEPDGIEARIVGVVTPPAPPGKGSKTNGKTGVETKVKDGTETKIRAGTEAKIRDGTEAKIRGEGVQFVWGNPPDGFFRKDAAK